MEENKKISNNKNEEEQHGCDFFDPVPSVSAESVLSSQETIVIPEKEQQINSKTPQTEKRKRHRRRAKELLKISDEFDRLRSECTADKHINRNGWLQDVLTSHPSIQRLRLAVNPITRSAAFARMYLPPSRLLSQELILALISQHFRTLGLTTSQTLLHSEWGSDFIIPPHMLYSQLNILLQRGVHRIEKFWELSMPSSHSFPTFKITQAALDNEISQTIGAAPSGTQTDKPLKEDVFNNPDDIKYDPNTNLPVEATLNQIIFYITTPDEESKDDANTKNSFVSDLTNAICLTISSYTSSKNFLQKLIDRFSMVLNDPSQKAEQLLCVKLFKVWIRNSINDIEPRILDAATHYNDEVLVPRFGKLVTGMFENRSKETILRIKQIEANAPKDGVKVDGVVGLWTGDFSLLDLPIIEFARQLTVWCSNKLYDIGRSELLDCAWEKPRLKYRAPNVTALTEHYNRLSQWVTYSILDTKSLKVRIQRIQQMIDLAQQLFDYNNFYDAMAVLSSFESNAMFRLKITMERVDSNYLEKLKALQEKLDINDNFSKIRKLNEEKLSASKPVLPYLGMLLRDLFMFYENTQTFVNGLINIRKCLGVNKLVQNIQIFKRDKYCFLSIDQVQEKIDNFKDYDEDLLYDMSVAVEKEGATSVQDLKDE
ncbi:RasGEF domain containing protein [Histomonas meleagridis]|uniref:RasGEF domain containing protein n=1 Tax=Histomonas meleagridis TaxID=135588 RepID=UPI00355A73FF|nr:RasGEF domain containing protein [Histomonas meleagridis]KAH0801045.1 RasGEF domain containing protein [Histomonas meleagridis]